MQSLVSLTLKKDFIFLNQGIVLAEVMQFIFHQ